MRRSLLAFAALFVGAGCGSEDVVPEESPPVTTSGCEDPLAIAHADGSCTRPGVPLDGCGEGFVHDGEYGCQAVLPPESCPPGTMAVVGETMCRSVMPCGEGKWGDIVRDATTQHVDQSYAGTSDGTEQQPWSTIQEAIDAARPGAVVAVTDGTYSETVVISGKPVRLRGVCPERVVIDAPSVAGASCPASGICIFGVGASGARISGVSVTGGGFGILISGSTEVVLERLWVHDLPRRGVNLQDDFGATSAALEGVLVEEVTEFGLYVGGSSIAVDASLVRDTLPLAGDLGHGLMLARSCVSTAAGLVCDNTARANGVVTGSVLERNLGAGITAIASDALVEDSVIRDTRAPPGTGAGGQGIGAWAHCDEGTVGCLADARAAVTVRRSVLTDNQDHGVFWSGAEVGIESTVIANTRAREDDLSSGRGLNIQPPCVGGAGGETLCAKDVRPTATVTTSLITGNHDAGIFLSVGDATIDRSVVRGTVSRLSDGLSGRGLNLQASCEPGPNGLIVCDPTTTSVATLTDSLIGDNQSIGLFVGGSTVDASGTVIRATGPRAADGLFGDGIAYVSFQDNPALGQLTDLLVEDSSRGGITGFGATMGLRDVTIRCAAVELTGETQVGLDAVIEDQGGNRCGCPEADGSCKLVTAGLEPPGL